MDDDVLTAAAETWQREGWVLVPGLVPPQDIDAALGDLWQVVPRPQDYHAGDTQSFAGMKDGRRLFRDGAAPTEGAAFRNEQFLGQSEFPFPGSGALNRLFVHPEIVRFASAALRSEDLRLYQMSVWAKYTGVTNYEQPLHTDRNHAVVPPRMEPGWWHLEGFLYLSDVEEGTGPTRLVKVGDGKAHAQEDLYLWEHAAPGPRGSYLAYRPDVFHRGVDLTAPGGARFLAGISFKLGHQDWIGYFNPQPRSGLKEFAEFMASCSPEELALLGVPRPGHPYWNAEMIQAMAKRYPGIDMEQYRAAL